MTRIAWVLAIHIIFAVFVESAEACVDYTQDFHWLSRIETPYGPSDAVEHDGYLYVADGMSGLRVVDVRDPAMPHLLGGIPYLGDLRSIASAGDLAVAVSPELGLHVFDIATPGEPVLLATVPTEGQTLCLEVMGDLALIGGVEGKLEIFDIAQPEAPIWLATHQFGSGVRAMVVGDGWVGLLLYGQELVTLDLSDPLAPDTLAIRPLDATPSFACLDDSQLFASSASGWLGVYDVTSPADPQLLGAFTEGQSCGAIASQGDRLFRSCHLDEVGTVLAILDVSDPMHIENVGNVRAGYLSDAFVRGDLLYAVSSQSGIGIFTDLHGLPSTVAGSYAASPAHGYQQLTMGGSMAYASDDYDRIQILDCADPLHPTLIHEFSAGFTVRSLAMHEGRLHVLGNVSTESNYAVYDVNEPTSPQLLGDTRVYGHPGSMLFTGDYAIVASGLDVGMLTQVWIADDGTVVPLQEAYLYYEATLVRALEGPDEYLVGESDQGVAAVWFPIGAHDGLVYSSLGLGGSVEDIVVDGDLAYLAVSDAGVYIVDVSNPSLLWVRSQIPMPAAATHVAKFSDRLYVQSESDLLTIVDVADSFAPRVIGVVPTAGTGSWGGGGGIVEATPYLYVGDDQGISILHFQCSGDTPVGDLPPALAATLYAPYPNPFNPDTRLRFTLPGAARARLSIFDVAGRLQANLLDGALLSEGLHEVPWDGRDAAGTALPSGVYLARLWAGGETSTQKLTLLR